MALSNQNVRARSPLFLVAILLLPQPAFPKICDPSPLILPLGPCNITSSDPNVPAIHSWGCKVTVGNGREICMCPGSVMNSSTVMMERICDGDGQLTLATKEKMSPPQCASRRGGKAEFSSFAPLTAAEASQVPDLNKNWPAIQTTDPFSFVVRAALNLFGGPENNVSIPVVGVQNGQNQTTSALSLGSASTLLDALFSAGRIFSHSFAFFAGSTSLAHPEAGHVFPGGYDRNILDGALREYPMTYSKRVNNRVCDLQVSLDGLVLRAPGEADIQLVTVSQSKYVCLEMYDSLFRMPAPITGAIKKFLAPGSDIQPLPLPADRNIFVNEPGMVFRANETRKTEWSLEFLLNRDFSVSLPSYELYRPLRGLDENGSFVVRDDLRELQMYYAETNLPLDAVVLGRILLSQIYVVPNFDTGMLGLGHVRRADLRSQTASNPYLVFQDREVQCNPQSQGPTGPTIGVIVLGVALGLLVIALGVGIWWLHRRGFPFFSKRNFSALYSRRPSSATEQVDPPTTVETVSVPDAVAAQHTQPQHNELEHKDAVPVEVYAAPASGPKNRQPSEAPCSPLSQTASNPPDRFPTSISTDHRGRQVSELEGLDSPISPTDRASPEFPGPHQLGGPDEQPKEIGASFTWPVEKEGG